MNSDAKFAFSPNFPSFFAPLSGFGKSIKSVIAFVIC
jgi:hypothetical protein